MEANLIPATDDRLRTEILTASGEWLSFQDYFVIRGHRDRVAELRYTGAEAAAAAPGVVAAIEQAAAVIIAPSNPPLSVWPILAVGEIRAAIAAHPLVIGVSPLFGGEALKGPAADVMAALGLTAGTDGVIEAYEGMITHLVVDVGDAADAARHASGAVRVSAFDTRIGDAAAGARLASELLRLADEAGAGAAVR